MAFHFFNKLKYWVLTIRVSILSIFISLFIVTMVSITVLNSSYHQKSMAYIAQILMDQASSKVLHKLSDQTNLGAARSQFTAHMIEKGILNNRELQILHFTYDLTKAIPLIVGTYWGDEQGNFIYSKEENDNTISSEIYDRQNIPATRTLIYRDEAGNIIKRVSSTDLSYDPRVRPWYLAAKKEKKTIWTDIYRFKPIFDLGISVATPAFRHGKLYGVFGIDFDMKDLSKFINEQRIKEHGFCFIITKKGKLIVYPNNTIFPKADDFTGKFINVYTTPIPLISQSLAKFNQSGKNQLVFSFRYNDETYMISYKPVPALADYGWLIGVIVPKNDFIGDLKSMYVTTLTVGLFILVLGMLFMSGLISYIVNPIKLLAKETENIKHFDLDGEISIKSRIKEIIFLKDSIHSMKNGLKLFQRYIPKILVRKLIESGEDIRIGGIRKKLAIFFSDIEGFTGITEKTEPNSFIIQISEYFEALTQIIINEKGTIDKYIGDSIMAFWGSPLPEVIPCHHAARAALLCQVKLNELNARWEEEGKPPLLTRIGIHMGDAIVGNIGSSERLNYTAIGDSINIANRLEAINKNYKTKIIVSDAVYEEIKDTFVLRLVDIVIVKGRTSESYIYELLGDDIHKIEFDIIAYRPVFAKGFSAYQKQQWDEAILYFKNCLIIHPEDSIAPIFIERCTYFKSNPPGSEWNGIMK